MKTKGAKSHARLVRLSFIESLMLQHHSVGQITEAVQAQFSPAGNPGKPVSDTMVRKDIAEIHKQWEEQDREAREHERTAAVRRLMNIARKAIDPTAKVAAEKEIAKILGLYAPTTSKHAIGVSADNVADVVRQIIDATE